MKSIRKDQGFGVQYDGEIISNTSGACANVVLITKSKIYCANLGDCRSAIWKGGKTVELSVDQTLNSETEIKRIKAAKGIIVAGKINGSLPYARSFGDFAFKKNSNFNASQQIVIS